jgi:peptidoglycan/LPS O-acetylase OafA/YrhL
MAFRPTRQKQDYRPDIDGLRAIAVLAVVFYHAGIPGFSGGFTGVDIFFVISGFLITGIVWSELRDGSFSLQEFYVRRIRRIFPALFALLIFCSIAAFILLIPADLEAFGRSVNATVLFFSNFHWMKNTNYFANPAIENPLLHTWSLSVEEQFYAVWPLAILLLIRTLPARKIPYIVLGLALVSLAFAESRLPDNQRDAFFLPWWRAWELLLGALLVLRPLSLRPGWLPAALGGTGLAAIALAAAFYDSSTRFPGAAALVPCGGAALLLASGTQSNPFSRLLAVAPIRHIGLISYSLYLIHWPLFSFSHLLLGPELPLSLRVGLIVASAVLAHASWRFVETPFRAARPPKLIMFGAAATAMSGLLLAGASFYQSRGFPFRVNPKVLQLASAEMNSYPYCRDIAVEEMGKDGACEVGESHGGAYDFVLWGDSHAAHFIPAIGTLARAQKLSGIVFSKAACHPFLGDQHIKTKCIRFNAGVARWLSTHPVKLVILAGRWGTMDEYIREYIAQKDPSENQGGLAKTLAFLTSKQITVSVIDQLPDFPANVRLCTIRAVHYGRDFTYCTTQDSARFDKIHQLLGDYFDFLKTRYKFSVTSAADAMCRRGKCTAMDGENILMADHTHLSEKGALYVMPYLNIPQLTGPGTQEAAAPSIAPAASQAAPAL